jgi:predicted nucleic acid-binding protein
MNAVDTNIFIYSIDDRVLLKKAKAQQFFQHLLSGSANTHLLWQVLGELVNQLRRWKDQGNLTEAQFNGHVHLFRTRFPLVLPTAAVIDHALDLAKRHSLSHWDSMILGACKDAGVTTLYTEDMGAPTTFDGIQLINPL